MGMSKETQAWLEARYIEWRNKQKRGKDGVIHFAKYLHIPRNSINNWMIKGVTPEAGSADRLAQLGLEIYDLLGIERPDPTLKVVTENWELVPDELKRELVEAVERAKARGVVRSGSERVALPQQRGKDRP